MGQYQRHVFVCTHGEYCPLEGAVEIHRSLKEGIAARGLKRIVRVNQAGCFSQCGNGPMIVVYPEDVWYGSVTTERAERILEEHLVGGLPVGELRYRATSGDNKNGRRMAQLNARRGGTDGRRRPGGE